VKSAPRDRYDRGLAIVERFVIVLGVTSLAIALVLIFTGWRLETFAWSGGPGGLFPQNQLERGERLYNVFCFRCHGGPDRTPGPAGAILYPPPHNALGDTWRHPDCELAAIVRDGGDDMTRALRASSAPPGAPEMPAFNERLSADEVAAVLAYIKTMWTPDERETNERLTRDSCPAS